MIKLNIVKSCKILSIPALIISIFIYIGYEYIDSVVHERENIKNKMYSDSVKSMNEKLSSMILAKQKATVGIALGIANDSKLAEDIINKNFNHDYYEELIRSFKSNTLYKNIWIQVIDKDFNSIHRSWTNNSGVNIKNVRDDLKRVFVTKKPHHSISVGNYTLSIKGMVPILKDGEVIGVLEVISHFNSISKEMKRLGYSSVVVVSKEETKKISNPFTKMFLDNHYIANFDAPKDMLDHIHFIGVRNYLNDSYRFENGYLITSHPIKNIDSKEIAYYIFYKEIKDVFDNTYLNYFTFKSVAIGVIFVMFLAILLSIYLFLINKKQRKYYHNIIDSSSNIVITTAKTKLIDVNDIFYKYFTEYKTIEEFTTKHECICEFFDNEDGYLQKYMDGTHWIEYVLKNSDKEIKAKVIYGDNTYYFIVTAAHVIAEDNIYAVIFSDITEQEQYKLDLEKLTITDPLSGINNRRYFQIKIEDEISRAKRYKHPLSLIIFDIDFFKKVNDKYGHNVGDEVIIEYSRFVSNMLREEDIFCRIGGEEFIVILPHIDKSGAFKVAEKIRSSVEEYKKIIPITMSFGVVEYIMGEESESVFHRADLALYAAKDSGRNRVKIG